MIISIEKVVRQMEAHGVRFIVIGGWAAIMHGSARSTNDVDLVYARDSENLARLVAAIAPWNPYLRGAPPGLPFRWDVPTIQAGLNFTLTTDVGDLDLLGEVSGGGMYEQLHPYTQELRALGLSCRVVTLERLIQLKRAAGRAKDLEAVAELQALLEERRRRESPSWCTSQAPNIVSSSFHRAIHRFPSLTRPIGGCSECAACAGHDSPI